MVDEIDIMDVDLGGATGKKNIKPKETGKENKDIIEAAPTRKFHMHYYINNQEPMPGEMDVEIKVNGTLSHEHALRELIKVMPKEMQARSHMVKLNHFQEVATTNLQNP